MRPIQKIGLALFLLCFSVFVISLSLGSFQMTESALRQGMEQVGASEAQQQYVIDQLGEEDGKVFGSQFAYVPALTELVAKANAAVMAENGVSDEEIEQLVTLSSADGAVNYTSEIIDQVFSPETAAGKNKAIRDNTGWMIGREFSGVEDFKNNLDQKKQDINRGIVGQLGLPDDKIKYLKYHATKAATVGLIRDHVGLFSIICFLLSCLGALLYIVPQMNDGTPGIKNEGVFFLNVMNRGWIGISFGTFLIGFYVFLYKFPEYITNWVLMLDPVSESISGKPADQWFMYGVLYCLAMGVMGIRMMVKYRHNRYQIVRTGSILFFQFAFAFTLPQILKSLNRPSYDLKSAWPLEYTFFFDYRLDEHLAAGTLGWWMIGWGIVLFLVGVPTFTYFFGKRWYCSWVCGCGGLAETLGDPYRQQSNKSTRAWKIERWSIHLVLVFAVIMTIGVVYSFLPFESISRDIFIVIVAVLLVGTLGYVWFLQRKHTIFQTTSLYLMSGAGVMLVGVMVYNHFIVNAENIMFFNQYQLRGNYGFMIGFVFSGVVGTGFYPLMGNRMWCRFGCPLAAYLGLIQRLKSRFRITTNGGQCISCGNCSTYCEMGIDVRAYAQKGQNIVRSSCVGCGICSAVCPRGVLKLENGPDDNRAETPVIIIGNSGVGLSDQVTY
ncbi:MAG: 4Fe-4S binding protein [Salibacteraceae bacterium]